MRFCMFTLALGDFGGETAQPIGRQALIIYTPNKVKYTIHSMIDDGINLVRVRARTQILQNHLNIRFPQLQSNSRVTWICVNRIMSGLTLRRYGDRTSCLKLS